MTQLILNISDPSVIPALEQMVKAFKGVTIQPQFQVKKCGLDEALEDVEAGRISGSFDSVDELMRHLMK